MTDDELDQERIDELAAAINDALMAHAQDAPVEPRAIYEALAAVALAVSPIFVAAGGKEEELQAWFRARINQHVIDHLPKHGGAQH